jgi:hypothetical protein
MTDEWERMWKEAIVVFSRQYPGIYLKGLSQNAANIWNSKCSARDSNRIPPKFMCRTQIRSVPAQCIYVFREIRKINTDHFLEYY